jgi:hypothetical protein
MAISKNSRVGRRAAGADPSILPRYNYSNGAGWCSKRDLKGTRRSATPGSTKTGCQITHLDKHMAKCSRSYKHRDYPAWLAKTTRK